MQYRKKIISIIVFTNIDWKFSYMFANIVKINVSDWAPLFLHTSSQHPVNQPYQFWADNTIHSAAKIRRKSFDSVHHGGTNTTIFASMPICVILLLSPPLLRASAHFFPHFISIWTEYIYTCYLRPYRENTCRHIDSGLFVILIVGVCRGKKSYINVFYAKYNGAQWQLGWGKWRER